MAALDFSPTRLALILGVAVGAHLGVIAIQALSSRALGMWATSETKLHTVTLFLRSLIVFAIYFGAFGFALTELGVSLTTYLASASVIGLAVSFGSQGVVQDVITGLTLVFSDLLDVGDMVEISGQAGIVESVSMRFTVIVNFSGARVFVPNRSIMNVISYPSGYIRVFLDARLPVDPGLQGEAVRRVTELAQASYEQYPGILLLPPTVEAPRETRGGFSVLRIKFRIWPGQGAVIETSVKAAVIQCLKQLDPTYADWMASVYYRAEPDAPGGARRLPRPAVLSKARPGSAGASGRAK